jgi:hypothetical protein
MSNILALSVVVLVTQEADAAAASKKFSFSQNVENRCSGSVVCSNSATTTITFRSPGKGGSGRD